MGSRGHTQGHTASEGESQVRPGCPVPTQASREGRLSLGLAEAWGLGPMEEAPAAFEGPVPRPRAGMEGPSALWGPQSQGS